MSSQPRRWRRLVIELAIAALLFLGVRAYLQRDLAQGTAPSLAGPLLDGTHVELADRREPTLVYFWATWCPICRSEHPAIESLAHAHRVVAIATQSGDANTVRAFTQNAGWRLRLLVDDSGAIARAYGVRAVPVFFIVDAQGRIRFVERGYTTGLGLRVRLWLAAHMS